MSIKSDLIARKDEPEDLWGNATAPEAAGMSELVKGIIIMIKKNR